MSLAPWTPVDAFATRAGYAKPGSPWRKAALAALALGAWFVYAAPAARHMARDRFAAVTVGDVEARRAEVGGQPVLFVEGVLRNDGKPRKAPAVLLTLVGDDGRPLYAWTAKPASATLGAETPFQTRLLAPPERFKSIAISLKDG